MIISGVFFVQTEPNSVPNFGLTQPNFGLTQPNFGLTQSNFPPNSNFRAKMVKIVALSGLFYISDSDRISDSALVISDDIRISASRQRIEVYYGSL